MVWFKVDDGFPSSRKVLRIPRQVRLAAIGLWTLAGAWSAGEELDGFVPDYMIEELGGSKKLTDALVQSGLWEVADEGSQFHKWAEYQPTRAQLEEARTKEAERKRQWRNNRKTAGVPPSVPPGHDAGREAESENPDPTRPDPTTPKGVVEPRRRGTRIPEPFLVSAEMRTWAADAVPGLNVDLSTQKFVNYWRAKAGRDAAKLDWPATWRNWLLNDHERSVGEGPQRKTTAAERAFALTQKLRGDASATGSDVRVIDSPGRG